MLAHQQHGDGARRRNRRGALAERKKGLEIRARKSMLYLLRRSRRCSRTRKGQHASSRASAECRPWWRARESGQINVAWCAKCHLFLQQKSHMTARALKKGDGWRRSWQKLEAWTLRNPCTEKRGAEDAQIGNYRRCDDGNDFCWRFGVEGGCNNVNRSRRSDASNEELFTH